MRVGGRLRTLDVAIAIAVGTAMELEAWRENITPRLASSVCFAVLGVVLLFRRVAPVPALAVGLASILVAVAAGMSIAKPVTPLLFYVLMLYAVGLYEERRAAVGGLAAAIGLSYVTIVLDGRNGNSYGWGDFAFVALIMTAPWFVGRAMRGRMLEAERLERRAADLERERLEAVAEERARIARELHDVIAHSVTVMVVQAGAAEEMLRHDPERALDPLRSVQDTGRQALVEMSRLVGLLREDSDEIGLTPQPRLGEVPQLIVDVSEAGLPVELHIEGRERTLPLGVELTAYRVVQEALTNAMKHAGAAHAEVLIRYGADALELEVVDDGAGTTNGAGGGHGLAGMRERVSVFGGDLEAGPRAGGGFAVSAWLPLEAERL